MEILILPRSSFQVSLFLGGNDRLRFLIANRRGAKISCRNRIAKEVTQAESVDGEMANTVLSKEACFPSAAVAASGK